MVLQKQKMIKSNDLGDVTTPSTKMMEESKEQDGGETDDHDDLGQHVRILNTMGDIDPHEDDAEESLPFENLGMNNTASVLGPNID